MVQYSACVNDAPKLTLCEPLIQLSVSSSTLVDASREELPAPLSTLATGKAVLFIAKRKPSVFASDPLHMDAPSSGENSVAPPVPPNRSSLTRLAPSVDRTASDVVQRVDCWLAVTGKPGKRGSWLFVVSGTESMCW